MQKTLTVRGKKFTARRITKLPYVVTNGGDYRTNINGETYFWNYRQIQDTYFAPVCNSGSANSIALMANDGNYKYSVWLSL